MERNPDEPNDDINLLIIDLGRNVIENSLDCLLLWDELESIAEDFPGYMPVFRLPYGA